MKPKEILIFYAHLILIILVWTSPFWLNWKIIFLFVILNYLQIIIFKACILTLAQFKEQGKEMTMYTFILEKIGFKINRKIMKLIAQFVMPWIILLIAIIWQILLKKSTLI